MSQTPVTSGVPSVAPHVETLLQGANLLRHMDPQEYQRPAELLPGGSIGAHIRHCLDFYRCFLVGLQSKRIDYDRRERSARLEEDPLLAAERIQEIVKALNELAPERLLGGVEVRGDGVQPDSEWHGSTPGRELHFLYSHAIHHYALVGTVLRDRGHQTDPAFGVAPSTLRHWENGGASA